MTLRYRLLAVLAIFALVAAACGSGDDAAETTTAATEATTATTVAETTATTEEMMDEPGTIVDVAVGAGNFTTLATALEAAGLVETLQGEGPFTVFAPTDEAFAALPEGTVEGLLADIPALTDVLLYHVVSGQVLAEDVVGLESATTVQGSDVAISVQDGNVFLNGSAQVVTTDIMASNGVIHVIDTVILPPVPEATGPGTIIDVATAAGTFTTLATALDAAGLVETLQGEGPFTVFAPTDEAFAALPEGTVEGLLADIPALTDVLLYHVVSGAVMADDVVTLDAATTVQGSDIVITIEDGIVYLNGNAAVTITDIEASNGIIHVIDAVILPPAN